MSASLSGRGLRVSGLTLWVLTAFIGAQLLSIGVFIVAAQFMPILASLDPTVLTISTTSLSYLLAFGAVAGVHQLRSAGRQWDIFGLTRTLSWSDMGIGALAILPYLLISYSLVLLFATATDMIDPQQRQALPFQDLGERYQYIIAFIALVVLAPIAEELMFRGYFLGKMTGYINRWAAVMLTSLIFGLLHLPGEVTASGMTLQWAAAVDTFALGLVLGALRLLTGSVWSSILLHMFKNAIAYFSLFVLPLLAGTM